MSGMFAPDDEDDRDEDEGWDSVEDYLRDRQGDMEYPDSVPDGVETDRVDVDPDLFGEFPDGPIEVVEEDGNGLVSGKAEHEWEREALIVDMTGACPYCDSEVSETTMRSPTGDRIVRRMCRNCDEGWVSNESAGFTGQV